MPTKDEELGALILRHLIDLNGGKCTITEEEIVAEKDETRRDLLAGLLMLHEQLELKERRRQEAMTELEQLNVELERRVRAQADALLELSTPVIEVVDDVLVLPVIGTLDTKRAQEIMDNTLAAIEAEKADVFIIDLTGLTIVDTAVARHVIDTTVAAKILGAEAILTGISPVNAQILITLGVDLTEITTCGTLKAGLERALKITGRRIVNVG